MSGTCSLNIQNKNNTLETENEPHVLKENEKEGMLNKNGKKTHKHGSHGIFWSFVFGIGNNNKFLVINGGRYGFFLNIIRTAEIFEFLHFLWVITPR